MRNWTHYYAASDRVRMMEHARDEANWKEQAKFRRPDTINWKTGEVLRFCFGRWCVVGEVLKDGRITWYGEIAGRVIDGQPCYGKKYIGQ